MSKLLMESPFPFMKVKRLVSLGSPVVESRRQVDPYYVLMNRLMVKSNSMARIYFPLIKNKCAKIANGCKLFSHRKSTRLNSSHVAISYAVFCLKKKRPPKHKNRNK